jgi:hypothetical protein
MAGEEDTLNFRIDAGRSHTAILPRTFQISDAEIL